MTEIRGLENVSFESAVTYTILEEIGRGGMGVVYLAERSCMGVSDLVVLKTIRSISAPEEEALRKEANIATGLRHENIVKTYGLEALPYSALPDEFQREGGRARHELERRRGLGRRQGRRGGARGPARQRLRSVSMAMAKEEERRLLLLVMDYIDGLDLSTLFTEHLKAGFLVPAMLGAFVVSRICRALAYAHETIVHRDVSPDNVMINRHGVCKLSDFGIAVAADESTRQVAGKTIYMAPEVYAPGPVDERIDVFSLGLVAYLVLTGASPLFTDHEQEFQAQKADVLAQLAAGIPPAHEVRHDVPEALSRIVERMMDPDPDRRYPRIGVAGDEIEKDYLYARGFGPTNNSLAAYIRIFESGFSEAGADELGQLSFLRDDAGRVAVERPIRLADYTRKGLELVKARKGSPLFRKLAQIQKEEQRLRQDRRAGHPAITFRYGDNLLETFLVGEGGVTIGREAGNTCVLADPGASRRHARVLLQNGSPVLEDLGSNNGTLVNGARVERASLSEGDRIQIGGAQAYYRLEPDLPPPARVLELEGSRPVDAREIEGNDVAIRFVASAEATAAAARAIEELSADVERAEGQFEGLRTAFRSALSLLAQPGRELEVRITIGSNRVALAIRDLRPDLAVDDLFSRLRRQATLSGEEKESKLRPLLRGADRIEHLPHLRTISWSRAV